MRAEFRLLLSVGVATAAAVMVAPPVAAQLGDVVSINEIRVDQTGADADEYLELAADPGTSLDGLSYIVIGDGSAESGSGVIEAVVDLSGQQIPASGFFVAAEETFSLGTIDLTINLNFENSDNVTHLLVSGFVGAPGDDLDVDDDGALDRIPWHAVVDAIALVEEENPPTATEFFYLFGDRAGPDGSQSPAHVFRCPDGLGDVRVGSFDPAPSDPGSSKDTPGAPNACDTTPDSPQDPIRISIPAIQGVGHVSPIEGMRVVTQGVVTAVDSNSYYLQDVSGDGDIRTSDAVLVFTGSEPSVRRGDQIEIVATVDEFTPGGASTGNLSITELVKPERTTLLGTTSPPAPVLLGEGGRLPPTEGIDADALVLFDPLLDGIDFFESLEGMQVSVQEARAVAGTNRFGELYAVVDGGRSATGLSARGTLNISPRDFNPERIQIDVDSGLLDLSLARVDTGAALGTLTGVVSYSFGNYEVLLTEAPDAPTPAGLMPSQSKLPRGGARVRIASFNVLNLDPNDSDGDSDVAAGRFDALGRIIAQNLSAPEIVALQEIQDDDGSVVSEVTSADETLSALASAIVAAGGPSYAFIDNPFIGNGTSGGQPGGNIRVAYLYDPARVRLIAGSLQTLGDPSDQQTNPANPFFRTRLPLIARFEVGLSRAPLTLINVHLSSKGGSSPLFGSTQPAALLQEDPSVNGGVDARRSQALSVASFVSSELRQDPSSQIAVLGDLNEFEFISPLAVLGENLMNLTWTLPEDERYSFIFDGNSQSLDHILVSESLRTGARYEIVHVNSEFAETPMRASDHDPVVASLRPHPGASVGRRVRCAAWRTCPGSEIAR